MHKFASCDGCQLAFLNAGEALLTLSQRAEIVHFSEAGWENPLAKVDIAFVEGSITTPQELERIRAVRASAGLLVTIGACATAGGLQALRNGVKDSANWISEIYASPEYIQSLPESRPISAHVKVDLELWGCPVTSRQVLTALGDLLNGITPTNSGEPVCVDCKRNGHACVLITKSEPCMGPVTRTGCGAVCPAFGRACYGCFGPAEQANTTSISRKYKEMGLTSKEIPQRFHFITSAASPFLETGRHYQDEDHD